MLVASNFFMLRTPALPLNFLDQFNGLTHDETSALMKVTFRDEFLREAIYLASPGLFAEMEKWQQGQQMQPKDSLKLELALFKYLLRMSYRCTPYGLFAGCAMGEPGQFTTVKLSGQQAHQKHSRLDMNNVAEIAQAIRQTPGLQEQLLYFPNNSLYRAGDRLRYTEYSLVNKFRTYQLSEIPVSGYLDKLLDIAEGGATIELLAGTITGGNITREEALEFVNEIIVSQVLVSELEPTVTGPEFYSLMIEKLSRLANSTEVVGKLNSIQQWLEQTETGLQKYSRIHQLVKKFIPAVQERDQVQVDMFLDMQSNTISKKVIDEILQQVNRLWPLCRRNECADLKNFITAFSGRFGEQEIPLALALDVQSGIGYGAHTASHTDFSPLTDDIVTTDPPAVETLQWHRVLALQQRKLHACLHDGSDEIELLEPDLQSLQEEGTRLYPWSLYLVGSIIGSNASAIDSGEYEFELKNCGGPSAASLLGRFCHGQDSLTEKLRECLREEEKAEPNVIFAELVHLPEARTGNVLLRPILRDYEIVYLGQGSVETSNQIQLSDLMVSVQNGRVVLRSARLNRQVIPRLSTAHDFTTGSLPAYKFLGDLQFQQLHGSISWSWNHVNDIPFLPRVRYGKIILAKRTWQFTKKDIPGIAQLTTGSLINAYGELRQRFRMPVTVTVSEGDNDLLINLENETSLRIVHSMLLKKGTLILQECLENTENCLVQGTAGRHTSEFILPLKYVPTESKPVSLPGPAFKSMHQNSQAIKRNFIPGSEWLFVKLYAGTVACERILTQVIRPLVQALFREQVIDRWFFIRYDENGHHLRLRFHHRSNRGFWKTVLESLHDALQVAGMENLVYKVQTDTYQREIERYGAGTIGLCEEAWHYDSEAVLGCIGLLEGPESESFRWLLACRGVESLLKDFGYSAEAKSRLMKNMQQGLFEEFDGGKLLAGQLNDKYRSQMQQLRSFMDENSDDENGIGEAVAFFNTRSVKLKRVVAKIRQLHETDRQSHGFERLVPSYIHMFLNRILISNHRKQEMVIYHFLAKYYDSQLAIHKTKLIQA